MRPWDVTPAAYLLDPIERAERQGFDLESLLAEIGVSRGDFLQPNATLSRDQSNRIIDYLLNDLGVADVGFVQPENEHLLSVGTAGLAAMTAATVGESLDVVVRFQHLLAVPTSVRLHERGKLAHLVFSNLDSNETRSWLKRWAVETSASAFAVYLEGYPGKFSIARFGYGTPENVETYQRVFACDLLFDQAVDELVFPRDVLDLPQPTANPLVHEIALRQCEQTDRLARPNAALVERIQSILIANASHPGALDDVARRLGLSGRTLQRRLRELGTSFRQVSLDTRLELARELLRTDLAIKEVAYLTGYTDVANFSAAFMAQAGERPSMFKASRRKAV